MEKYQFTMLTFLAFSESDAKTASKWYQGPGWYYHPVDGTGKVLDVRLLNRSELPAGGQLEALNECGAEGWSVAVFMPAPPEGVGSRLVGLIAGMSSDGPYFI